MTIYKCNICGNITVMLDDKGVNPDCCGQQMELLQAKTSDAGMEKHVPVITKDGSIVTIQIGETLHPMTAEHRIEWILLETGTGFFVTYLKENDEPIAHFVLDPTDKAVAAYAYCNIHGLWMKPCC